MYRNNLKRWLLLVIFITFRLTVLPAQEKWTNVDSLFLPLPDSVHVYRTNDSIDGQPNIAYYIRVPLADKSIVFDSDTALLRGFTPSQYFLRNNHPLVVVNCTFFSKERRNLNVVVDEGRLVSCNVPSVFSKEDSLYHYITRSAIGFNRHNKADIAWVFTDTVKMKNWEVLNGPLTGFGKTRYPYKLKNGLSAKGYQFRSWKMQTAVGGGPNLVSDRNINITNEPEHLFTGKSIDYRHPRTAMGYTTDDFLIIMVIEGRNPGKAEGATLLQTARMLKDLGCAEALNLDGGGSSCLLINGKETIRPSDITGQRPVPAVFMIKIKDR